MIRRPASWSMTGRMAWLVACLAAGGIIGAVGHALTADAAWVLALPAALAVGWWFVADPQRCLDGGARPDEDRRPGGR